MGAGAVAFSGHMLKVTLLFPARRYLLSFSLLAFGVGLSLPADEAPCVSGCVR